MERFLLTGTLSSFRVRWGGWSPSWLVPLRATEDSRSKLSLPSGFGYSMGVQSLAGFSWLASRPDTDGAVGYEMSSFPAEVTWTLDFLTFSADYIDHFSRCLTLVPSSPVPSPSSSTCLSHYVVSWVFHPHLKRSEDKRAVLTPNTWGSRNVGDSFSEAPGEENEVCATGS